MLFGGLGSHLLLFWVKTAVLSRILFDVKIKFKKFIIKFVARAKNRKMGQILYPLLDLIFCAPNSILVHMRGPQNERDV